MLTCVPTFGAPYMMMAEGDLHHPPPLRSVTVGDGYLRQAFPEKCVGDQVAEWRVTLIVIKF